MSEWPTCYLIPMSLREARKFTTPWPVSRCPSHLFVAPNFFHRYAGLRDGHRSFGFYVAKGLATLVSGKVNEFCRVENPETAKRNPCIVFMDLIVALNRSGPSP